MVPPIATAFGRMTSSHHVRDEPARSNRQHNPDEHAHALERVGVGARQVGIRHDHREQPEQAGQQTFGRLGNVGMHPGQMDVALPDAVEGRLHDANDQPRQHDDDEDVEQSRDGIQDARDDSLKRANQERAKGFAPRARVREEDEG